MLARYLPILEWGRSYDRGVLTSDLMAAVIVTIMLIPQSLAYAMLAGLPPVVGLYASILPLVAYALFGTSRTLAVGPVAVVWAQIAIDEGPKGGWARAIFDGPVSLGSGIFEHGFDGGGDQGVFGGEMGIEAAMGQADLLHQGRYPDPLRAMGADLGRSRLENPVSGLKFLVT